MRPPASLGSADRASLMSQRSLVDSDRFAPSRQPVWTALACAAILGAGIAAWSDSFSGPFIFDDFTAIRDNLSLRHFPAWSNLLPPPASPISRRPVVNLTLAITYAISGNDVRGFHAGNLFIHLLATVVLYGIIRRTFASPRLRERFGHAGSALAFAIAIIWAVHPLQTEPVTYMTQRTELLMGLFCLLTLYGAIRAASSQHPWRWYATAIGACALGMGSKEVMAAAPIIAFLYDRCFLSGSFREALHRRFPLYLGLAATWAVLGALFIVYPSSKATSAGFGLAVSPWEYARTQPGVILHYLRLSFWPSPLCLDYAWPIATNAWRIITTGSLIAALLAATLWALWRAPAIGFLGASFFLILAPSSSFIPIVKEIAAERRMYLPLATIVAGCVLAVYRFGGQAAGLATKSAETRKHLRGALAVVALLGVTVALGQQTFTRNALYADAISIWQDTARKRPWNSVAQNNLGTAYLGAGRPQEAIGCLSKAIESKPDLLEAYINRGAAYTVTGQLAEARRDLDHVLELNPASAQAYANRAAVYYRLQQYELATADCNEAIKFQPGLAGAYNTRGAVEADTNHLDEAIQDCTRALELQPGYVEALENRSNAYLRSAKYTLAAADCDQAIALSPRSPRAYINRAAACSQIGQYQRALADVQKYRELGGQPPADFVEALLRAAGQAP